MSEIHAASDPLDPVDPVDAAPPLVIRADGPSLLHCLEALLAVQRPPCPVEVSVVRSIGQVADWAWLHFVTSSPAGWWERNGLAVEVPGLGAGRRMVVDLEALAEAVGDAWFAPGARKLAMAWCADGLRVGEAFLAAQQAVFRPIPDIPSVRDAVYLTPGDPTHWPRVIETEQGRITVPGPVVALLHQRNAAVAEFGMVDGEVYLVAQSEARGAPSTDPTIIARTEVEMWSDATVQPEFRDRRRQGGNEVEQLLAALDPQTPPAVLLELLDTATGYVRRRVAAHPGLPGPVLVELARCGTRTMRAAVATNPALAPELVATLAADGEAAVREAAVANPRLAPELRAGLATDPAPGVRRVVAILTTDPKVLGALATDVELLVREAVAGNPGCPGPLLERMVVSEPYAVLANPSAPEQLLVEAAREVDGGLRAVAAGNPATPARVLAGLARDPDARVLRALVGNPSAPAAARRRAEKRVAAFDEVDHTPRVVTVA